MTQQNLSPVHYDFYKRRMGELIEQFPELFNRATPEPLAVGITNKLVVLTQFSRKEIAVLMRVWCSRREYTMMACSVGSRVDVDGSLHLISEKHLQHYLSQLEKMNPKHMQDFAIDFELTYDRKPFASAPEAINPRFKEGYIEPEFPYICAELRNVELYEYPPSEAHPHGMTIAWANIFNDRASYGNHPLRQGAYMHTSPVISIKDAGSFKLIFTKNSVYKTLGPIRKI